MDASARTGAVDEAAPCRGPSVLDSNGADVVVNPRMGGAAKDWLLRIGRGGGMNSATLD